MPIPNQRERKAQRESKAMTEPRRHISIDGHAYRVRLAPLEGPGGVHLNLRALVFEREDGSWVGSVRVVGDTDSFWLTESELDDLLERAR